MDVGGRETAVERQAGDPPSLKRGELFVETPGRIVQGAAGGELHQERQLPKGLVLAIRPVQQKIQMPRRAGPRLGHVHMGIGPVGDHGIGPRHHFRRHVGVQIEACDQGRFRSDHAAHPAQDLPFAVLQMLGHHGAVQVEIDAVQVAHLAQILDELRHDAFEGVFGDVRRRLGRGPGQGPRVVAQAPRFIDEAGDRDVDPGHGVEQGLAARETGPAAGAREILVGRLAGREGIGLVLKAPDGDLAFGLRHGSTPTSRKNENRPPRYPRPSDIRDPQISAKTWVSALPPGWVTAPFSAGPTVWA